MHTSAMAWVLSIFELVLIVGGFLILLSPVKLLITGHRTKGTVVSLVSVPASNRNSETDSLYTPQVEFYTLTGTKVTTKGSASVAYPSTHVGDSVTLVYNRSNPQDNQILSWTQLPLIPAGVVFGFALLILAIWISCILGEGDHTFDDPLGLLPWMISHFQLNPVRFPILFILSLVIPTCIIGTYTLTKDGIDLRAHGIKVIGHVDEQDDTFGALEIYNKKGGIVYVTFEDKTGATISIKTALHRPYSRLKPGDTVEVIYPVNKPDSAVVNVWHEIFLVPAFFGFFTLMMFIVLWWILKNWSSL